MKRNVPAIEGTGMVWNGTERYLMEWNVMGWNGMLGKENGPLTKGMEGMSWNGMGLNVTEILISYFGECRGFKK